MSEYFWLEFEKNYCRFRNQYPQIFHYSKFHAKIDYLHLRQKMLYLDIFGLEFEKAIVIFEINVLKFV